MYLYYTGNVKQAGDYDYITAGRGHNTALAVSRDGVSVQSDELLLTNADYPAGLTCHVRDPKVWQQDGMYYMVLGARTLDDRGRDIGIRVRGQTAVEASQYAHHTGKVRLYVGVS